VREERLSGRSSLAKLSEPETHNDWFLRVVVERAQNSS
jgi:hypothetical protein